MKKTIATLLACAMTATVLTGCSGADKTQTSAAETTAEQTSADKTAEETTEAQTGEESEAADAATTGAPTLRVGSLKGPTTIGLVSLMDEASKGESEGAYEFTMAADASELAAQVVSGDLDIALVPANLASVLYQKTKQGIEVIDINTLECAVCSFCRRFYLAMIADLKGKTIYMTGKGTTPDYALQYLIGANSMTPDDVTIEYKSEATEVAAVLKENPDAIGLLPQPFVTATMAQNENLKMVLNLTEEWDKTQPENGSSLVTGVTVCRKEVLEQNPEEVETFLKEHKESADWVNTNVADAAELVAAAGIIEKAPVAQKAIPYCSIVCIDGEDMKTRLSGYLEALFELDPSSVGGQVPDDGFYYLHE